MGAQASKPPATPSPKLGGLYRAKSVHHGRIVIGAGPDVYENPKTRAASINLSNQVLATTSLRKILDTTALRKQFLEHLTSQHCEENVAFFDAVYKLQSKGLTAAEQMDMAAKIVETYVADSGEKQILLTPEVKNELLRLYSEKKFEQLVGAFKPALTELFLDLKNSSGFQSFIDKHVQGDSLVFSY
jgi:hypothetical protein